MDLTDVDSDSVVVSDLDAIITADVIDVVEDVEDVEEVEDVANKEKLTNYK